jgi:hypothetical protein
MKLRTVISMLLLTVCLSAADVTGKWKATTQGPDGEIQLVFNLHQDGDKVTGNVESPMGELPVSEGKIDRDKITFTVETDQFKVVHKGTVSGDEMKLKVEIGEQTMDMTAKRVKP